MNCKKDVIGDVDLFTNLHLTFLREWTRVSGGQQLLDMLDRRIADGLTVDVPEDVDRDIQDCLIAMDTGGNVPGIWGDSNGECYHDWMATACFAHAYMKSDSTRKESIKSELRSGNATVPNMCSGEGCCPPEVWTDGAYLALDRPVESSWPWWKLGLASVVVGLTAAFVRKNW